MQQYTTRSTGFSVRRTSNEDVLLIIPSNIEMVMRNSYCENKKDCHSSCQWAVLLG